MVKTFIKAQNWTVFLFHFWYWVKRCCFVICFNCFFFCIYYLFVISIDIYLYIYLFFPLHINDSFFKLLQNWSLHLHSSHWLNFADYFFKVQLLLCHGACTKLSNQISGKEDWIWKKKFFSPLFTPALSLVRITFHFLKRDWWTLC